MRPFYYSGLLNIIKLAEYLSNIAIFRQFINCSAIIYRNVPNCLNRLKNGENYIDNTKNSMKRRLPKNRRDIKRKQARFSANKHLLCSDTLARGDTSAFLPQATVKTH